MILSRFEIKTKAFNPYSFGVSNDGFTKRGVVYAQISIGGQLNNEGKIMNSAILHIFNTHMQSSMFNAPHH